MPQLRFHSPSEGPYLWEHDNSGIILLAFNSIPIQLLARICRSGRASPAFASKQHNATQGVDCIASGRAENIRPDGIIFVPVSGDGGAGNWELCGRLEKRAAAFRSFRKASRPATSRPPHSPVLGSG